MITKKAPPRRRRLRSLLASVLGLAACGGISNGDREPPAGDGTEQGTDGDPVSPAPVAPSPGTSSGAGGYTGVAGKPSSAGKGGSAGIAGSVAVGGSPPSIACDEYETAAACENAGCTVISGTLYELTSQGGAGGTPATCSHVGKIFVTCHEDGSGGAVAGAACDQACEHCIFGGWGIGQSEVYVRSPADCVEGDIWEVCE